MSQRARVLVDSRENHGPEFPVGDIFEHRLSHVVSRLFGVLASVGTRSRATLRAELVVGRDHLGAVTTPDANGLLVVFAVDDTGLSEDRLVVLLGTDVLVGSPHVGVDRPLDAVLDLRPVVPLPAHSRDRGVPEVVRVDGLVDATVIGGSADLPADGRRRERTVFILEGVAVAGQLVEEGDVRVVRPRVDVPDVGPHGRLRVDDGVVHDLRTLQAECFSVRSVGGTLAIEIDVADAERAGERHPAASVREELDEGDVPKVRRALSEGFDVLGLEHVLRTDLVVGLCGDVVLVGPRLLGHPIEEVRDGELDVPDGVVAHPAAVAAVVAVPEVVDVGLEVGLSQLDERDIDALPRLPEVLQVLIQRGLRRLGVLLSDVPLDQLSVGFVVDLELLQFPLESLALVMEIIQRTHSQPMTGCYKNPSEGKRVVIEFLEWHDWPIDGLSRAYTDVSANTHESTAGGVPA